MQPEHGIRTVSSHILVRNWSVLPEGHFRSTTGQNLLLQSGDSAVLTENMCLAPAPCTSSLRQLHPELGEDKTSWALHRTAEAEITPWVLLSIPCKQEAATVPHQGCPEPWNQPAFLVMRSARDGGSNTDFPVDYTEKAISWLQALLEEQRFFASVILHDKCQELK